MKYLLTNLDGGLVSVELGVFAFDHSVAFKKKSFSWVALLLLLKHPLRKSLSLLAEREFLGLCGCGRCLVLLELSVCLFRESLGDVCSLVLEITKKNKLIVIRWLSEDNSAGSHSVSAICTVPTALTTNRGSFVYFEGWCCILFPEVEKHGHGGRSRCGCT